jgi:hypothetical protein
MMAIIGISALYEVVDGQVGKILLTNSRRFKRQILEEYPKAVSVENFVLTEKSQSTQFKCGRSFDS